MRILLLGCNGQVGWELQRSLSPLGTVLACDRSKIDLTNLEQLKKTVIEMSPDVIVNASAHTAVDKAETTESELAYCVNAEAVKILADSAKQLNAWLLYYSTDYVFDGSKSGHYAEHDKRRPLNVYGKTKVEGENAILENGCKHLLFRTSWVYAARGNNFLKTILRLAKEREELKVIADQFGAPTSAELIADVTAFALHKIKQTASAEKLSGIYHLTASGETSWHQYTQFIVENARLAGADLKLTPSRVIPIPTEEYPLPAVRPRNSRLDVSKLESIFDLKIPEWRWHVARTVREIVEIREKA